MLQRPMVTASMVFFNLSDLDERVALAVKKEEEEREQKRQRRLEKKLSKKSRLEEDEKVLEDEDAARIMGYFALLEHSNLLALVPLAILRNSRNR